MKIWETQYAGTMDLVSQRGDIYLFGRHVIEVNIHRRDAKSICAFCQGIATPVFLADYDSEEKALTAFGAFKAAICSGADCFRFPDNESLDDLIRTNGKKGYAKTTGKTK